MVSLTNAAYFVMMKYIATLIPLLFLTLHPAHAAEFAVAKIIEVNDGQTAAHSRVHLTLIGDISPGDTTKLTSLLDGALKVKGADALSSIHLSLNSAGGSFAEGVALMHLFKDRAIETIVAPGNRCLSACALAFLGGTGINDASEFQVSRTVYPGGLLGFHAPSLNLDSSTMVPAVLMQDAYAEALNAIGILINDAKRFDILPSLLQKIITTPPEKMYIVQTVDDFARWRIAVAMDTAGWVPSKADLARICANYHIWLDGSSIIESDARLRRQSQEWTREGFVAELANRMVVEPVQNRGVVRVLFAHVLTLDYEYREYCVVRLTEYAGGINIDVHKTTASPQTEMDRITQSNLSTNRAYGLHALPADFAISRLSPVPYP